MAVRFLIKNIPEQLRQMGMSQLQAAANGRHANTGASEQIKQVVPLITRLFNDLDEVTLGLKIDSSSNKCHLDLEIAAKSGTKLADRFAAMKGGKTAFAGVRLPDAALVISKTQSITDDDVASGQAFLAAVQKFWNSRTTGLPETAGQSDSHLARMSSTWQTNHGRQEDRRPAGDRARS